MDKTARPSARSNRSPRPISGRPAGVKILAGYWILVPKSGTSNVRQSTGLCSRNRASALGTRARSMMAAARQAKYLVIAFLRRRNGHAAGHAQAPDNQFGDQRVKKRSHYGPR